MEATVSLDGILTFINSLSLSSRNKRWLGEKLIESSEETCASDSNITSEMIKKHFGVWADDSAPEEIIRNIAESRLSSKRPLCLD